MGSYCYPNKQVCTIDTPKPKACIECIYIKHFGAKDTEDLHRKIVEMFDTLHRSKTGDSQDE